MSVTENDLEILESYLDDELAPRELEALRQRLSSEPALASAMDELRAEREMRQSYFASCEPDDASVERLVRAVNKSVTQEIVWSKRSRSLGWIGGLAACLLVGFGVGRGFRGATENTNVAQTGSANTGVSPVATPVKMAPKEARINVATNDGPLVFDGPAANPQRRRIDGFSLRGLTVADVVSLDPFPGGHINVVDNNGRIMRTFDSHEQYLRFVSEQMGQTPSTNPSDGH
jgi:hypothetical protein